MEIFIALCGTGSRPVEVDEIGGITTVGDLRNAIARSFAVASDLQAEMMLCLAGGVVLDDDAATLAAAGVSAGSSVSAELPLHITSRLSLEATGWALASEGLERAVSAGDEEALSLYLCTKLFNPERAFLNAVYSGRVTDGVFETFVNADGSHGAHAGVNPDTVDSGEYALQCAAKLGNLKLCDALLAVGCSVDGPTGAPRTPLLAASLMGKEDTCRLLIAKGARVADPSGVEAVQPLTHWCQKRCPGMVTHLLENGAPVTDKLTWHALYDAPTLDVVLRAGAPADKLDEYGCTPLKQAATSGLAASVSVLLKHGAVVTDAIKAEADPSLLPLLQA